MSLLFTSWIPGTFQSLILSGQATFWPLLPEMLPKLFKGKEANHFPLGSFFFFFYHSNVIKCGLILFPSFEAPIEGDHFRLYIHTNY